MSYAIGVVLVVGLFVAMVVLLEAGRRLGHRPQPPADEGAAPGTAAVDGAVFGLLRLLLAFTFAGAIPRWDTRRDPMRIDAADAAFVELRQSVK